MLKLFLADGGHLGWRVGSSDTTFKRGLPEDLSLPSLVQIGSVVSEEKIFKEFFAEFSIFSHGGHLGWRAGSSDTILKGDHPRTIPAKFGPNWPSGFRGED